MFGTFFNFKLVFQFFTFLSFFCTVTGNEQYRDRGEKIFSRHDIYR